MNTQHTPPPMPEEEPKQKGFLRKAFPYAAVAVVSMIIGGAMGSTNESPTGNTTENQASEVAEEAPTETVTETVEVEVEVTPEDCVVALTHADDAIDIYSQALTVAGDGIMAYADNDVATINESTAEIESLTGELTTTLTSYYINSEECRGNQ